MRFQQRKKREKAEIHGNISVSSVSFPLSNYSILVSNKNHRFYRLNRFFTASNNLCNCYRNFFKYEATGSRAHRFPIMEKL